MSFNNEKFKELVHYICAKAKDSSVLGSIKLNKVLYYSDVIYYMVHGQPITGETYIKRQFGPVPRHILPVMNELVAENKVARGKHSYFGNMKNEFISISDCDISCFSSDQIAIVDEAFEHVCMNHTATSISEETHGLIWQLANMGEEIPYCTVFASEVGEVDEDDLSWAQQELRMAA